MTDRTNFPRTFTILALALMSQSAAFAQTKPVTKKEPQTKPEQKQPSALTVAPVPAKAEAPKPLPPKFTLKMGASKNRCFQPVTGAGGLIALD